MAVAVDFDDPVIILKADEGDTRTQYTKNKTQNTKYASGVTTMPIYEYCCEDCKGSFEKLIFGSEKPDCPSCSSKKVTRLMSSCGFVSKGGGGETTRASASASSCGGCAATSCATCGH